MAEPKSSKVYNGRKLMLKPNLGRSDVEKSIIERCSQFYMLPYDIGILQTILTTALCLTSSSLRFLLQRSCSMQQRVGLHTTWTILTPVPLMTTSKSHLASPGFLRYPQFSPAWSVNKTYYQCYIVYWHYSARDFSMAAQVYSFGFECYRGCSTPVQHRPGEGLWF